PRADVGDAALITGNDNFGSFCDCDSVFAPRGSGAARACLRKDHLAGAGGTNVARDGSEDADHIVIGGGQFLVLTDEKLRQEKENDRFSNESTGAGEAEREQRPEARKPGEHVTGAAEPCKKRRHGSKIDTRGFTRVAARVWSMCMIPTQVDVEVGQMQMPVSQKRQ